VKAAVIIFPGSNREWDVCAALKRASGHDPIRVWHREAELPAADLIVLPGGFAYGDYLRCGAMAAHSPIMREVKARAAKGVPVLGICNGFQILCEAGMLPGALLRNAALKYVCKPVDMDVVNPATRFTRAFGNRATATMPVGNGEGNYFASESVLDRLEGEGRVVFRYRDNPNGSARAIAGILNEDGNVLGVMPHPDRAYEADLGSADGALLFQSVMAG
jgi:phosphoribosylformylglycinamidine synthase